MIALHSAAMLRIPVASIAIRWSLIGLAVGCALGLLLLVFVVALDKDVDAWSRIALFAIAISACVATFLVSPPEWDSKQPIASATSPKFLAVVIGALFVSFEMTNNAVGLFSPRSVVESEPLAIENTVKDTNRMVAEIAAPKPSMIAARIDGLWGESAACDVAYSFALEDEAVTVEREAASLPDFTMLAVVKAQAETTMTLAVEHPARARGQTLDLKLEKSGPVERLVWDDLSMDVPLKLVRCGDG